MKNSKYTPNQVEYWHDQYRGMDEDDLQTLSNDTTLTEVQRQAAATASSRQDMDDEDD